MASNLEAAPPALLPERDDALAYPPIPEEGLVPRTAKWLYLAGYRHSGLMWAQEWLRRRSHAPHMTILLFHRVTNTIPRDGLTIGVERFRELCRRLRSGYHVVPLADVFRHLQDGTTPPPRTVAITFDDCYADNLPAAEVLHEHGLPAAFFVPTDYVGTSRPFPWDAKLPPLPNLSWADLRRMASLGHTIESHSASHVDFGRIDPAQAREELTASRKLIEDRLGQPVRYFAFPFGSARNIRPEQLPLVRETGYEGCVSAEHGFVERGMAGQVLPRVATPSFRSVSHLEMHITRCLDWVQALKRRLGTI
jgi:peptidoglycan/xylan/chitin deacetylase (PgdA/CDA1 family)